MFIASCSGDDTERSAGRAVVRLDAVRPWTMRGPIGVVLVRRNAPSQYARDANVVGLDIIAWTFERSHLRRGARNAGWYYRFEHKGCAITKV